MIFAVFPQFTHIFECLAFGLGDEFPYEDGGYDTDDAVKGVSNFCYCRYYNSLASSHAGSSG